MRLLPVLLLAFVLAACLGQAPAEEGGSEPAPAVPAEPTGDDPAIPDGDQAPAPADPAPEPDPDPEPEPGPEPVEEPTEDPAQPPGEPAGDLGGDPAEAPDGDGSSLTDVILGASEEPDYDPHRYFLHWEPCLGAFGWEVPRDSVDAMLSAQPVVLFKVDEALLDDSPPHFAQEVAAGLPTGSQARLATCEGDDCPGTVAVGIVGGDPWEGSGGSRGTITWPLAEGGEGSFEDADGGLLATLRSERMGYAVELSESGAAAPEDEAAGEMAGTLFGEVMAVLDQEGMAETLERFRLALTRVLGDVEDPTNLSEEEAESLLAEAMGLLNTEDRDLIDAAVADLESGTGALATPEVAAGSGITCGAKGVEALSTAWHRADWLPIGGNLRMTFTYQHMPDPSDRDNWVPYLAKVDFHNLDNGHKAVALFNYRGDVHKITVMDAFRRIVREFDFKFPYEGDFSLREVMRVRAVESRRVAGEERPVGTYLIPYETYRSMLTGWLHPDAWGREGVLNLAVEGDDF